MKILTLFLALFMIAGCQTQLDSLNDLDKQVGETIQIQGQTKLSQYIACTRMYCGEENPCCNGCSGGLDLETEMTDISLRGDLIDCHGNDCGLNCTPIKQNKQYIIEGKLDKQQDIYMIEVTDYQLIKDEE